MSPKKEPKFLACYFSEATVDCGVKKEIKIKAQGPMAETLEHEIDHLNGILYIDHVESRDKLYRMEQQYRWANPASAGNELKVKQ